MYEIRTSNKWTQTWQTQWSLPSHSIVFKGLSANRIEWRQDGEQIEITCSTDQQNQGGLYLYHTYRETREVFYLTPEMKYGPRLPFDRRVEIKGLFINFTATISNLSIEDTGVFWCQYLMFKGAKQHSSKSNDQPVMLVVNGKNVCLLIFVNWFIWEIFSPSLLSHWSHKLMLFI